MPDRKQPVIRASLIIPVLAAAMVLILASGVGFYRIQRLQAQQNARADIEAIANFKAQQIIDWRAESLADAAVLMHSPIWVLDEGQPLPLDRARVQDERLLTYFHSLQKDHDYRDVLMADPSGRILLSLSGETGDIAQDLKPNLHQALLQRRPTLTDLRAGAGSNSPNVQLTVPLFASDKPGAEPRGALFIQIDAGQFLYPITQTWPTPTGSGEILFVRREGDEILYLNNLRFAPNAAMKLREPLTRTNLPGAMAVQGMHGVVSGADYRNVQVLAALRAIPNSPWIMVAKIDRDEAMKGWQAKASLMIAVLALLMLSLASAIRIVWQQHRKFKLLEESAETLRQTGEELLDREEKLMESEERFRKLFEDSAEAILLIEKDRFIDCNAAALKALRMTSRDQVCDLPPTRISPVYQPDGLSSESKAATLIALAFQNGSHSFEWEHLRADGEAFLVEVVLTTIKHRERRLLHVVWRDITERRRTENKLNDALALNQELIGAALMGILAYDASGACVLANEAATRAIGAKRGELLAQNFRQLDSWKKSGLLEHAERALASDEPQRIEIQIVTTFHREAVLDCSLSRFESGGQQHLLMAFSDVTERRRAEEQKTRLFNARIRLMQAANGTTLDSYLQMALDEIEAQTSSSVGFYHFMDANQETLSLQAWSTNTTRHMCKAEGKGQHYAVSLAGVWADCVRTRAPVIQNDYASLPHKKGLPDGHARIVRELVVPVLRNGVIVAVIGVGNKATDYLQGDIEIATLLGDFSWEIVERKRAEEALLKSELRLRLATETASMGIWDWNPVTNVIAWNLEMFRLYGLEPTEDLCVNYQTWADALLPEDLKEQERILRETSRKKGHSTRDFRIRRASDGQVRYLHAEELCLIGPDDKPTRVLGVNLDNTERQRLLTELSRSNTDLEQFAYVASHDLKSPLRAIDSLANWLQEDLETVLTGENRKYLQLLRQRVGRMEQLLDDLLTYSRAGRVVNDVISVNVPGLLAEIVDFVSPPPAFSIQFQPAGPTFSTAVTPLRQVLTNLIANAIKHHDQAKGVVEISVEETENWLIFSVADDGPGIEPEFHERIFGMFQTLRPRDEVEGSGIGLALARRIITHYGGHITVECRQPRGTLFRFNWPKTIPIYATNTP